MPIGPNFYVSYQWTRNADAANETGLVPDSDERSGNLSGLLNAQGQPVTIYDPATGLPFVGNIPVSSQAAALLNLYPQPNLAGNSRYNYQAEVLNDSHVDELQSRLNKMIGRRAMMWDRQVSPSISGMLMSSVMTSGLKVLSSVSASAPLRAVRMS